MTSYLSTSGSDQDARRVAADLAAVYAARGTSPYHHRGERARGLLRILTRRA